jgi:uncharacterized membrane protein YqaE (UPF0057 family)
MKTSNYLLLIIIASVVFSSCSSLSISRKRYSRGLNIDWFTAKEDKATAVKVNKTKTAPAKDAKDDQSENETIAEEPTIIEQEDAVIDKGSVVNAEPAEIVVDEPELQSKQKAPTTTFGKLKAIKKLRKEVKNNFNLSQSSVNKTAPAETNNDSDVALILLVILAFLLPPLAVYLYFGEANLHFWLNLILWLLAVGVIVGGFYIGYGLPVVHALLVVFGVFD